MNPVPKAGIPGPTFINAHSRRHFALAPFRRRARLLLERESGAGSAVNVIFTDDPTISGLNRRFRKKNKPTDVLSFPFSEPDFLGEIYISLDRAALQAREYGAAFREEVWRLVVHGLFHLLGHTHYRRAERLRMEALERKYLE